MKFEIITKTEIECVDENTLVKRLKKKGVANPQQAIDHIIDFYKEQPKGETWECYINNLHVRPKV